MTTDDQEPVRQKTLTGEQLDVIKNPTQPGQVTKITAYAGTGKTSTLSAYSEFHHQDTALYLAFNKSVAEEARNRFEMHVTASTIHGLAYRAMNARRFGPIASRLRYGLVMKIFKLNTLYKAAALITTLDNFLNSAAEQTLALHLIDPRKSFKPDELLAMSDKLWAMMRDGKEQVPMTHSGYLKLYQLSKPYIPQKLIMLDEAQDTNPVTFDIVMRQVHENKAKLIMVGDRRQAIYGWRGAINAMDMETQQTFHLTQSFRFGQEVANLANGLLTRVFRETILLKGYPKRHTVIVPVSPLPHTCVCRTNYVLVTDAIRQAMLGRKVCLVGDYENFLADLLDVFSMWAGHYNNIKSSYIRAFGSFWALKEFSESGFDQELAAKVQLVEHYQMEVPGVLDILRKSRASEQEAQVLYTTVHKAKGREWPNVRLVDDFVKETPILQHGEPMKREDEEEFHALYVAVTRPLDTIVPTPLLMALRRFAGPGLPPTALPETVAAPLFEPEMEDQEMGPDQDETPPPRSLPQRHDTSVSTSLQASLEKQEAYLRRESEELTRRGRKIPAHEE